MALLCHSQSVIDNSETMSKSSSLSSFYVVGYSDVKVTDTGGVSFPDPRDQTHTVQSITKTWEGRQEAEKAAGQENSAALPLWKPGLSPLCSVSSAPSAPRGILWSVSHLYHSLAITPATDGRGGWWVLHEGDPKVRASKPSLRPALD